MLPKYRECRLQRADRPEHVLLVRVEFSQLLLAQSCRFGKGVLVLLHLFAVVLDLYAELSTCCGVALYLRPEAVDASLCICDGLALLLVIGLTPASQVVIDFFVL